MKYIFLWPSGKQQVFKNVDCCRFFKITEGDNNLVTMPLQQLDFTKGLKDYIACAPTK